LGNAYEIRIPYSLVQQLALYNGLPVDVHVQDESTLVIKIIKKYDLGVMLAQISDDNIHELYLDVEDLQGVEEW
jgi:antitoxin component of MazEF toxin-antitoxin module